MSDMSSQQPIDEAARGEWFCDQCGSRYPHPGECANQHPPVELKPVSESTTPELEPAAAEMETAAEDARETQEEPAATEAPAVSVAAVTDQAGVPVAVDTAAAGGGHPFQDVIDSLEHAVETLKSLRL